MEESQGFMPAILSGTRICYVAERSHRCRSSIRRVPRPACWRCDDAWPTPSLTSDPRRRCRPSRATWSASSCRRVTRLSWRSWRPRPRLRHTTWRTRVSWACTRRWTGVRAWTWRLCVRTLCVAPGRTLTRKVRQRRSCPWESLCRRLSPDPAARNPRTGPAGTVLTANTSRCDDAEGSAGEPAPATSAPARVCSPCPRASPARPTPGTSTKQVSSRFITTLLLLHEEASVLLLSNWDPFKFTEIGSLLDAGIRDFITLASGFAALCVISFFHLLLQQFVSKPEKHQRLPCPYLREYLLRIHIF